MVRKGNAAVNRAMLVMSGNALHQMFLPGRPSVVDRLFFALGLLMISILSYWIKVVCWKLGLFRNFFPRGECHADRRGCPL